CQIGGFAPFGYGYNSPYISPYAMRVGSYGATNELGYGYSQYSQPYGYGMAPYSNPYYSNGVNGGYGSSEYGGRGMSSFLGGALEGVILGATLG
ncbi:hypothetical protein PMAYCL1PPCAC_29491, partial [Pristionchus mayeri]